MKFLAVDVGTGTQDVLLWDARLSLENGYKLVLPSPTLMIRRQIQTAIKQKRDLVLTGVMMGGGPSGWAVEDALKAGCRVYATPQAARTLDDDLERVRELGVILLSEDEAARLPEDVVRICMQDFDLDLLQRTFALYGIGLHDLAAVAVAVFDHGNAPAGVSDRRFRFDYLKKRVLEVNRLSAFAYMSESIPPDLTRMQAVAEYAGGLDCPLVLLDSAPAAVLGATFDPHVADMPAKLIVNLGNMHTLAFRLGAEGIVGIFEHHTPLLNAQTLESMIRKFAAGTLGNDEVYGSHGHGAYLRAETPFDLADPASEVVLTGPRRGLLNGSNLLLYQAAPFGDMMLAGCYGLLAAVADLLPEYAETIVSALQHENSDQITPWDIE